MRLQFDNETSRSAREGDAVKSIIFTSVNRRCNSLTLKITTGGATTAKERVPVETIAQHSKYQYLKKLTYLVAKNHITVDQRVLELPLLLLLLLRRRPRLCMCNTV